MSLIQSMQNVGRPVAYYPRLARFFGSINAAIFFSQLAYWQSRTDNPLGVHKTAEEWQEETGLSYREQATARKHLAEAGFLSETHKRLEHRVFYRLDFAAIDSAFGEWTKAQPPECASRNPPNDESAIRGERKAQFVSKAETTSETTAKKQALTRPEGVGEQVWADFLAIRKAKRSPLTTTALAGIEREAEKAGKTLHDALAICCERGWQGFKAEWVAGAQVRQMPMTPSAAAKLAAARTIFGTEIEGSGHASTGRVIDITPTAGALGCENFF